MPSNHLILCHPLLLLSSIFPSIKPFSKDSGLRIRWPMYWSFSMNLFNEYSGLISFRMDWLDLLAVQGTLKSLLQHHSSKASILRCSAFFRVQLSHPYMTTGKTIALTRWTFVGKVISLVSNMLSRLVIAFLPRSKCLLISRLQSPSAVILELPKNKVSHCFHLSIGCIFFLFFSFFECSAICWAQLFCVIGYIQLLTCSNLALLSESVCEAVYTHSTWLLTAGQGVQASTLRITIHSLSPLSRDVYGCWPKTHHQDEYHHV